tara:strand:+ start:2243 stop:2416 length:174 start_codon:yes stop_codon:yes gene_type:complete
MLRKGDLVNYSHAIGIVMEDESPPSSRVWVYWFDLSEAMRTKIRLLKVLSNKGQKDA